MKLVFGNTTLQTFNKDDIGLMLYRNVWYFEIQDKGIDVYNCDDDTKAKLLKDFNDKRDDIFHTATTVEEYFMTKYNVYGNLFVEKSEVDYHFSWNDFSYNKDNPADRFTAEVREGIRKYIKTLRKGKMVK